MKNIYFDYSVDNEALQDQYDFYCDCKKIPTRRLSRKELKLIGEAIYKPLFRHCDELDEEIYNAFDELLKINF